MQKSAVRRRGGTALAGSIILLVALCIIFVTIAVPHMRENNIFNRRVTCLLEAEYERLVLSDPLYQNAATPLERGAEVVLTPAQVERMRVLLADVVKEGFRNVENESRATGAWDMKCQLRDPDGTRTDLFFTASEVYFYADGTAFCFEPKDLGAYDAFYAYLRGLLSAQG